MNRKGQRVGKQFPSRLFLTLVGAISLALALSSFHTFVTLREVRIEYLDNRARDLAMAINRQLRGPGRRIPVERWRPLLDETLQEYPETAKVLAMVDPAGRIVAVAASSEGDGFETGSLWEEPDRPGYYFYEHPLRPGRGGPRWNESDAVPVSRLVIGLDTSAADFLSRQAYLHLLISLSAIGALALISVYLVRTTRRFLELKVREESEQHLANLGRLSATLAHEIGNPLGAVKGLTQLVREELPGGHTAQEKLKTVISEAERLEHLVRDLLTFARPRALEPAEFRLDRLAREVVDFLRPVAASRKIAIELREPGEMMVVSDGEGVRQILLNLLKNAIEAAPDSGRVEVVLRGDPRGRLFEVSVTDDGAGLESDPEELFQPFQTSKVRGSGLGLPISRQIAERLGGTVSLANREEAPGAIATLRLPGMSA